MEIIDINYLKKHQLIVFECLSGSKAYGLDNPNSDTDIKGIFILPQSHIYGLDYVPQVSDEKNDTVYYEIGRFVELLIKNNPTVIELISTPKSCIRIKHPLMDYFNSSDYLSKLCESCFAGYAMSQIKKAKGLNKKIHNPVEKERKSILDFCYVNEKNGSIPLNVYLTKNNVEQKSCGLVKITNMHGLYGLYHEVDVDFGGIAKSDLSNDITLSSIPKEINQKAVLYFNKDGYSYYCKTYKEYWNWVEKRNEDRFSTTMTHGKSYDAKNMMHTFRLLRIAKEIGETKQVNIWRSDRDFLLAIKAGHFEYEDLIKQADDLMEETKQAFAVSNLPKIPNTDNLKAALIKAREVFYATCSDGV